MLDVLTSSELEALTGYRRPAYQARWLAENGIRHWRRKDGLPVVPRSTINEVESQTAPIRQGPRLEGLATRGAAS